METWDAIRSRRNVRSFTDQPIPDDVLDQILEAGRRTPSARNVQPWNLIVVTDRNQLEALSRCWQGARWIPESAAAVCLVAPNGDTDRSRLMHRFDLGQLTMTMMLAAADLGVGSGHAGVEDQDLAREVLGFPEDHHCALMIGLGYPSDRPLSPIVGLNRRPFDEVVHRGRW